MGGKSLRKCEICGVRVRTGKGSKSIFLARFPLEPNRCRLWVKATGNEDLAYLPLNKLYDNKFICGDHFPREMFNDKRSRLKTSAVPILNLFSPPLSDEILADFPIQNLSEQKEIDGIVKRKETSKVDIVQKAIKQAEIPLASKNVNKDGQKFPASHNQGDDHLAGSEQDDVHTEDDHCGPPAQSAPAPNQSCAKNIATLPTVRYITKLSSARCITKLPTTRYIKKLPTAKYLKIQPMDSKSPEKVPTTSQIVETKSIGTVDKQYGHCRCCLKTGMHCTVNIKEQMQCLNVEPTTDPRVPPLVCFDCGKFLQQAKTFRDKAIESDRILREAVHALNIDNDEKPPIKTEYVTRPERIDGNDDVNAKIVKVEYISHVGNVGDDLMRTEEVVKDTPDDGGTFDRVVSQLSDYTDYETNAKENLTDKDINDLVIAMKKEQARWSSFVRENLIMLLECSTITPFASIKGVNFDCIYCDGSYPHISELRQHMEEKHVNVDVNFKHEILKIIPQTILRADISCIKCRLCEELFTTIDNLVDHLVNVHKKTYHKISTDPPHKIICFDLSLNDWKCLVCDKVFPTFKKLRAHVNQHYGAYLCHQCGSKFLYPNAYSKHMQFHKTMKDNVKHICDSCGETFKIKKDLLYHKHWSHGDKLTIKRKSEEPPAGPRRKIGPITPPEETSGEIYKCILCNNDTTFTSMNAAYMHRIGHLNNTREGPFVCELCQLSFTRKINLKYHIQLHYGVKSFTCEVCNKKFLKKSHLSEHMHNNHLNLRYQCPLCDTTMTNKSHVKRHVRNMHPDVTVEF